MASIGHPSTTIFFFTESRRTSKCNLFRGVARKRNNATVSLACDRFMQHNCNKHAMSRSAFAFFFTAHSKGRCSPAIAGDVWG